MGHKHAALPSVVPRIGASRVAQLTGCNQSIPVRGLEQIEKFSLGSLAPANPNGRP
jgi:hypothetical protein